MEIYNWFILTPNWTYNIRKIIIKMQGFWIWSLFSCLTNLNWVNSGICSYGSFSNSNLEWICKFLCNALLLNGIVNTLQTWTSHHTLDHVNVHCTLCWYLVCNVCRIEVESESEITPSVEDIVYEPRSQGKQTPIDHVDKFPLPS